MQLRDVLLDVKFDAESESGIRFLLQSSDHKVQNDAKHKISLNLPSVGSCLYENLKISTKSGCRERKVNS